LWFLKQSQAQKKRRQVEKERKKKKREREREREKVRESEREITQVNEMNESQQKCRSPFAPHTTTPPPSSSILSPYLSEPLIRSWIVEHESIVVGHDWNLFKRVAAGLHRHVNFLHHGGHPPSPKPKRRLA
jgi:hypothetical protein